MFVTQFTRVRAFTAAAPPRINIWLGISAVLLNPYSIRPIDPRGPEHVGVAERADDRAVCEMRSPLTRARPDYAHRRISAASARPYDNRAYHPRPRGVTVNDFARVRRALISPQSRRLRRQFQRRPAHDAGERETRYIVIGLDAFTVRALYMLCVQDHDRPFQP